MGGRSSIHVFIFFGLMWFLSLKQDGFAQTDGSKIIVGAAYQYGSVITHTPKIRHFARTRPTGLEINLQKSTTGTRAWQQLYRYPRLGLSFVYFNYFNPVIGQSFAISPYLSLPVHRSDRGDIYFRFGTGLAYFTNPFHRRENPTNNIISAHFNAVIQTRLEYNRRLSNKISLLTGIGLNHYSNGGNAKPNLGVNITTFSLGLNYHPTASVSFQTPAKKPEHTAQKHYVSISSSLGVKQRDDFDTVRYLVNSMAIAGYRRLNQKSTLQVALEGFYDPSLFPRRNWDPRVKPGEKPDIRRASLNVGHELAFGKVSFGTHVGLYIYRPYKSDAPAFQRLETKVHLHRNIFVAAGLKLHDIIKADIIEYRLGLRI